MPVTSTTTVPRRRPKDYDGVIGHYGHRSARPDGRPADRVHEPATRDGQAKALAKQPGDLAKRHADLFVEDDRPRHRQRAELTAGRSEGIGRLQRMAALHAPATRGAVTDRDMKGADNRPHDGEIFLILSGVVRQRDGATTVGTRGGERRVMPLIHVRRRSAMCLAFIRRARFAAGSSGLAARGAARERCGLPMQRTSRFVEVILEPIDLLAKRVALPPIAITVSIRALMLAPQSLNLALLPLDLLNQVLAGRRAPSRMHAPVMARLKNSYKYKYLDSARRRASSTAVTR